MIKLLAICAFEFILIFCVQFEKVKTEPFDISTLPTDWTRLTMTDSIPIIYSTCDGGNRLISITTRNEKPGLLLHGQQEDYEFELIEAVKTESNIILITTKWRETEKRQIFRFSWTNEEKGLAKWETVYSTGFSPSDEFVMKEFEYKYQKVEQPCIECWDEEDCELMERNKNK